MGATCACSKAVGIVSDVTHNFQCVMSHVPLRRSSPAQAPARPANSNHWCASPAACCLPGVAIHPPYAIVRYHQQTRDPLEARLPEAPTSTLSPSRRDNPVAHTHTHTKRERERERDAHHTRAHQSGAPTRLGHSCMLGHTSVEALAQGAPGPTTHTTHTHAHQSGAPARPGRLDMLSRTSIRRLARRA